MAGNNPGTQSLPFFRNLLRWDAEISQRWNISSRQGIARWIFTFLAHSGDSWFMAPAMAVIWLIGDGFWKWLMLVLFAAMCVTAVTAVATKKLIGRSRPAGDWGLVYRSTDPHSFPSGHAARLSMLAILSLHVAPLWFAVLLLLWAPLVGYARIAMGVHYISDVAGGIAMGVLFGVLFVILI